MDRIASAFHSFWPAVIDVFKNRLTHILLALAAAYWTIAAFVPGRDLIEILGMVSIGIFAVAAIRWATPAIRSLREGDTSGVAQLLIGVMFFMASSAIRGVWSQVWRWNEYAGWMVESPWLGFIMLSSICGAAMMITSPGATEGAVPHQNWRVLAIAIGVGGVLVGFMLKTAVDTKVVNVLALTSLEMSQPQCGRDRQIWGNTRSKVYHDQSSPYRRTMRPTACFTNVAEARQNGYRPATVTDR